MEEQRESRFERGLILLESGHHQEARYYLKASLEKEEFSEECYLAYNDACSHLHEGAPDREEVEYEEQEGDEFTRAGLLAVHQGLQQLNRGRYGRAIQKLREAVILVPETAVSPLLIALSYKAQQYMERHLYRKAVLLYDECLNLGQDEAKILYLRAWAHLHAGNIKQAQADVTKAQQVIDQEEAERLFYLEQRLRRSCQVANSEAGAMIDEDTNATPLGA